jgi:hypothetical protein
MAEAILVEKSKQNFTKNKHNIYVLGFFDDFLLKKLKPGPYVTLL